MFNNTFYIFELGEEGYRYKKAFLENTLIPKLTKEQSKPFETIVTQILTKKESGEDTTALEREIDVMVYRLYELTEDEIKTIES